MKKIKYLIISILIYSASAWCSCESSLALKGSISVSACDPAKEKCISSTKAIYDYTEAYQNDSTELSVAINSSPWNFYDPDMRIVRIKTIADKIRSALKPHNKYVLLVSSWSAVSPDKNTKSLAAQLSEKLGEFPVKGQDGFVWMSKDGKIRTTKQAFTMFTGSYTKIPEGSDVFVSMAYSWPIQMENKFFNEKDSKGMLLAGAGWEIFSLCPDKALDRFEASASLSNPIGAYNASIILLSKMNHEDTSSALRFLDIAAKNGDKPSNELLHELGYKQQ